jgi:Flp pilus assembly protein TadD
MTSTPENPAPRPASSATLGRRLERAGWAFETGILEQLLEREPDNLAVLVALAESCTRMRRYRRGLELDRQLVARDPNDPVFRYNLACSLSLTGDLPGARDALLAAFALGYRDFAHLRDDPDLRRLRRDPRWETVAERMLELAREDG